MTTKIYRLTDQANVELCRRASDGKIALSDRGAQFELLRGTVELETKTATPARSAAQKQAAD